MNNGQSSDGRTAHSILLLTPISAPKKFAPAIQRKTSLDEPTFDLVITAPEERAATTGEIIASGRGIYPSHQTIELPELRYDKSTLAGSRICFLDENIREKSLAAYYDHGGRDALIHIAHDANDKVVRVIGLNRAQKTLIIVESPLLQQMVLKMATQIHFGELRKVTFGPCEGMALNFSGESRLSWRIVSGSFAETAV